MESVATEVFVRATGEVLRRFDREADAIAWMNLQHNSNHLDYERAGYGWN